MLQPLVLLVGERVELKEAVVLQNLPVGVKGQGLPQRAVAGSLLPVGDLNLVAQHVVELPPGVVDVLEAVHAAGLEEIGAAEGVGEARVGGAPGGGVDQDQIHVNFKEEREEGRRAERAEAAAEGGVRADVTEEGAAGEGGAGEVREVGDAG